MTKLPVKRVRKPPAPAKREPHRNKPKPLLLPTRSTITYNQDQLDEINRVRRQRYEDLLNCARSGDTSSLLLLPSADMFKIPMAKVCPELSLKIEFLDIFHYLESRQEDIPHKISHSNFGHLIGCHIPKSTMSRMLKNEDILRAKSKTLPPNAHYIVNRKHDKLEQVLNRWLEEQRKQNIPVSAKMIKKAAAVTHTILATYTNPDERPDREPSFTASWFTGYKKRHQISYCQLQGEAGSVDMVAIEPELVEIRALTAQFHPRNIVNCDETGMYLKELDTKSYTSAEWTSGAKANRNARVSILFCINADGSSLHLADTIDAYKPLVIATNHARGIDEDAEARMVIRKTRRGWMTGDVFMEWLQTFDDQLSEPTLLLLDSCPAHNDIDMRDPVNKIPWKHLIIRRLPVNSTAKTQPLDAGVISVFKRAFLELLSQETHLIRNYDQRTCISNGEAWSLIPHAWSRVNAQTLRNCFANTPVLTDDMRQQLRSYSLARVDRRGTLHQSRRNDYKAQERTYFEHLVAATSTDKNWTIQPMGNRDAQEIAEAEVIAEEEPITVFPSQEEDDRYSQFSDILDEPPSSPLASDYWDSAAIMLRELAGDHDIGSAAGLKEIRRRTRGGTEPMLRLRSAIKEAVRAAIVASKVVEVEDDGNETDEGSISHLLYSENSQ